MYGFHAHLLLVNILYIAGELWGVCSEDFGEIDRVITAPHCITLLTWVIVGICDPCIWLNESDC